MRALVLATASLLVATGCSDGPSCEDSVANMANVSGLGGASYGGLRSALVQTCKDRKWSAKLRSCAASAKTTRELDACEKYSDTPAESGRRAKRPEAEVNLEAIKKSLGSYYIEKAEFPKGTVPLTPAASCCETQLKKCAGNASDWHGVPIWDELDFEVLEPHYFQYSYSSIDGQTAIVEAVGDLDCDTTTATYTLRCEAPQGNLACTIERPARPD